MLIGENQQAFDSPEHIYELKLDGIRCLAYLWEGGLELQNRRNKRLNAIYADFPDFEDAVWIMPQLVCRVEFMERTPGGGLRQPVFRGLRDDKAPEECVISVWQ